MKFLDTGPWDGGGQGRPAHQRIKAKHGLCVIIIWGHCKEEEEKRLEIIKKYWGKFYHFNEDVHKIDIEKFVVFTKFERKKEIQEFT